MSAFCLPAAFRGKPVKLPSSGPGSMRMRRSSSLTISQEPTSSTFVGPPSGSAWAKAVLALMITRTATRSSSSYPQSIRHGAGFHFDPSGSRLKCMLVVYSPVRYFGSLTYCDTVSQTSPFGNATRSQCSVSIVWSL